MGESVHSKNKTCCVWQMQNDQHGCALCTGVGQTLKLCQLAERPIQKKNSCCFHPQNNYPLYSTPRHTHTLQTWQLLKETRVCPCVCMHKHTGDCGGSGRIHPLPRASCPSNSNASAVAEKPHRVVVNILYSKEKINTSSSEPRG